MTILILDINDVVKRIKSNVSIFKSIQGAAELESAIKGSVRTVPSCFVVPLMEDAKGNTSGTLVTTQRITDHFAVVYAVKNVSDPTGAKAISDDLRTLRLATLAALVGWAPQDGFNTCEFEGGVLLKLSNGTVFWRDRFKTTHTNEV